jgi:hypothetical protein
MRGKGETPAEHLVQNDAEAKDVGAASIEYPRACSGDMYLAVP